MGVDGESTESSVTVGGGEEVTLNIRCTNGSKFSVRTSLGSTVEAFKAVLAQNCDVPANQQRLIYKGRVLKGDQTLDSYGLQEDHTVHMVRGSAPTSTPPASTPSVGNPKTPPQGGLNSNGPDLGASLFPAGLGFGAGGGGALGLFGASLPEFEQVLQQLTQNPNTMREIINTLDQTEAVEVSSGDEQGSGFEYLWDKIGLSPETNDLLKSYSLIDSAPFLSLQDFTSDVLRRGMTIIFAQVLSDLVKKPMEDLDLEIIDRLRDDFKDLHKTVNVQNIRTKLDLLRSLALAPFKEKLETVEAQEKEVRGSIDVLVDRRDGLLPEKKRVEEEMERLEASLKKLCEEENAIDGEEALLQVKLRELEAERESLLRQAEESFGAGVASNAFASVREFLGL